MQNCVLFVNYIVLCNFVVFHLSSTVLWILNFTAEELDSLFLGISARINVSNVGPLNMAGGVMYYKLLSGIDRDGECENPSTRAT